MGLHVLLTRRWDLWVRHCSPRISGHSQTWYDRRALPLQVLQQHCALTQLQQYWTSTSSMSLLMDRYPNYSCSFPRRCRQLRGGNNLTEPCQVRLAPMPPVPASLLFPLEADPCSKQSKYTHSQKKNNYECKKYNLYSGWIYLFSLVHLISHSQHKT